MLFGGCLLEAARFNRAMRFGSSVFSYINDMRIYTAVSKNWGSFSWAS